MRKVKNACLMAMALMLAWVSTPAVAAENFYGGWSYTHSYGSGNTLVLGDSNDNTGLYMTGTSRYCGRPGDSYSDIRYVLNNNDQDWVNWSIVQTCSDRYGEFARICVRNKYNERACSTFLHSGWHDFDNP